MKKGNTSLLNLKSKISFDKNYDYKKLREKVNWDKIFKSLEDISDDFMQKRITPPQKRDFD